MTLKRLPEPSGLARLGASATHALAVGGQGGGHGGTGLIRAGSLGGDAHALAPWESGASAMVGGGHGTPSLEYSGHALLESLRGGRLDPHALKEFRGLAQFTPPSLSPRALAAYNARALITPDTLLTRIAEIRTAAERIPSIRYIEAGDLSQIAATLMRIAQSTYSKLQYVGTERSKIFESEAMKARPISALAVHPEFVKAILQQPAPLNSMDRASLSVAEIFRAGAQVVGGTPFAALDEHCRGNAAVRLLCSASHPDAPGGYTWRMSAEELRFLFPILLETLAEEIDWQSAEVDLADTSGGYILTATGRTWQDLHVHVGNISTYGDFLARDLVLIAHGTKADGGLRFTVAPEKFVNSGYGSNCGSITEEGRRLVEHLRKDSNEVYQELTNLVGLHQTLIDLQVPVSTGTLDAYALLLRGEKIEKERT